MKLNAAYNSRASLQSNLQTAIIIQSSINITSEVGISTGTFT